MRTGWPRPADAVHGGSRAHMPRHRQQKPAPAPPRARAGTTRGRGTAGPRGAPRSGTARCRYHPRGPGATCAAAPPRAARTACVCGWGVRTVEAKDGLRAASEGAVIPQVGSSGGDNCSGHSRRSAPAHGADWLPLLRDDLQAGGRAEAIKGGRTARVNRAGEQAARAICFFTQSSGAVGSGIHKGRQAGTGKEPGVPGCWCQSSQRPARP